MRGANWILVILLLSFSCFARSFQFHNFVLSKWISQKKGTKRAVSVGTSSDLFTDKGLDPSQDILKLLSSSPVLTDIGHGVKSIDFDKQKFRAAVKPFGYGTMSHTLYERSFYPELLAQMHTCRNVALIGSAGTSKSTFQYWLFYTYLQGTVTNYRADGT